MKSHSDKVANLEDMGRRAYEAWRGPESVEWSELPAAEKARWMSVAGAVIDGSSYQRVRVAAIAECANMLVRSYPDHVCTNAFAAAVRSLSLSHAFPDAIGNAGGLESLARYLLNDRASISDAAWKICEAKPDMLTYARRAVEWFGANAILDNASKEGASRPSANELATLADFLDGMAMGMRADGPLNEIFQPKAEKLTQAAGIVRAFSTSNSISDGDWNAVVEALEDCRTHRAAWRNAIGIAFAHAKVCEPEIDDKSYWDHELKAFDRTFAALATLQREEARESQGLESAIKGETT